MKRIISIFLFSLVILSVLPQISIAESNKKPQITLSFGVVPQQSATELAKIWTPFLNYLNKKTGYSIHFKTAKDIATFEERIEAGEYDIAYFNPLHYVSYRSVGYMVFAKEKDTKVTGIIVVHKDSPYQKIADIDKQEMAFPSPSAFAATILPLATLKKEGITVIPKYVASHDSVYRTIAKKLYLAGGGIIKTLGQTEPEIRKQLRILWTSPSYTPHPIAAHPRVPKKVVQNLKSVMLNMHKDPEGMALLKDIGFKGIVGADDSEYDDIRSLNLNLQKK